MKLKALKTNNGIAKPVLVSQSDQGSHDSQDFSDEDSASDSDQEVYFYFCSFLQT